MAWKPFVSSGNDNVWGPHYKCARNGSARSRVPCSVCCGGSSFTLSATRTAECLLDELIPSDEIGSIFEGSRIDRVDSNLSELEMKRAICRMAPNKAPRLDGNTAAVFRKSWSTIGAVFTRLLDRCLRTSTFPDIWKTANVVVLFIYAYDNFSLSVIQVPNNNYKIE